MSDIEMTPVTSSNVHSIGHDAEAGEMHVKFHSGATHAYQGVTPEMFAQAQAAPSIGQHVARVIIPNRPSRKIQP